MKVSYKKLWKMLIDQDMKKRDLEKAAGISHYTINKLNHGDNVTTDVLGKICMALNCTIDDIMEFVVVNKTENNNGLSQNNLFYKRILKYRN